MSLGTSLPLRAMRPRVWQPSASPVTQALSNSSTAFGTSFETPSPALKDFPSRKQPRPLPLSQAFL
jgi:hypothetical protein